MHITHENGEVIEVVPSSNPDSPLLDRQEVVEVCNLQQNAEEKTDVEQDVGYKSMDLTTLDQGKITLLHNYCR